jgi:SAM-dependent methyltransferase
VAELLPDWLQSVFGVAFIRSDILYDEFIHRLTVNVFRVTGLEAAARAPGTADDIATRAGIDLRRGRVPVDWMLRRLAHRGLLEQASADGHVRFHLREAMPELEVASFRDEACRQNPSWLPSYVLAETVARDYPAFLRGERTGEQILFSPDRLRLWVNFFSNDNGLYVVNNIVGAGAVEAWLPKPPVAIMELGGGLGSGATAVLERLRSGSGWAGLREYRFTELVPAFLRRGQHTLTARFADAGFLTFASLDMDVPFAKQGVSGESFSLVYAVNTLHVARDLEFTLREVFQSLEPGGQLVISECVRTVPGQPIVVEFIFNLMETFRSPMLHPVYRPNGGFLTPEQWRSAIEAAGFVDVRIVPDIARLRARVPEFNVAALGATRPA